MFTLSCASSLHARRPVLVILCFALAAAFWVWTAATVQADGGTVWSATLSVKNVTNTTLGCSDNVDGVSCESGLSDNTFEYDGVAYTITELRVSAGTIGPLILGLDRSVSDSLKSLTLLVCEQQFPLADAAVARGYLLWNNTALGWEEGQTIAVSLGGACGNQRQPGVTISQQTLSVEEHGDLPSEQSSATYTIVLDSEPEGWVRITVRNSDTSRIRVYPGYVEFWPDHWDTPQTVKVTARFDYDAAEDTITLSHFVQAASPQYQGMSADPVTVTMTDVDIPAVVLSNMELNLNAGQASGYGVRLDAAPTGSNDVIVTATSSAEAKATVSPASFTFTADNWDGWQYFTVIGVAAGDVTISHTVSGTEETYVGNVIVESVAVTITALPRQQDPPREEQRTQAQQAQEQLAEPEPADANAPGPVGNVELAATSDTVTVTWDAPSTGGAPKRYIVWLKPVDGSKGKTKRPAGNKLFTTFRKLKSGATYDVSVRAQNKTGKGERTWTSITLPTADSQN